MLDISLWLTQLMADTAKYYNVNVIGVVTKCLSCSLEKIRQKNIGVPKKNEDTSKIQERECILIYHQ